MIARGQHGRLVEIFADLAAQGGLDGAETRERRGQPVCRVGDALEVVDIHCRDSGRHSLEDRGVKA